MEHCVIVPGPLLIKAIGDYNGATWQIFDEK